MSRRGFFAGVAAALGGVAVGALLTRKSNPDPGSELSDNRDRVVQHEWPGRDRVWDEVMVERGRRPTYYWDAEEVNRLIIPAPTYRRTPLPSVPRLDPVAQAIRDQTAQMKRQRRLDEVNRLMWQPIEIGP